MIRFLSVVFFVLFVFIQMAHAADPFESTICASGTITIVHGSKELTVMSFELKGIALSNTNSEIYHNASERCVGINRQMGGEWTQSGYCKYLYPNGDFQIGEFKGNMNGGEWKFLLGTGKWEGIKGGGSWSPLQRAKPIVPGTFQNCRNIKGTYKLPK